MNMFNRREPAEQTRGKTGKALLAALLLSAALIFFPNISAAQESLYIRNSAGNAVFSLNLYGQGEVYWYDSDNGDVIYGARDFAAAEIADLRRGLDYWTAVLQPAGAPFTPVVVRADIDPDTSYNAAAVFFSEQGD